MKRCRSVECRIDITARSVMPGDASESGVPIKTWSIVDVVAVLAEFMSKSKLLRSRMNSVTRSVQAANTNVTRNGVSERFR